ncbi:MAG: trypsin-like serine protease [Betaproteobacteria bacterium]
MNATRRLLAASMLALCVPVAQASTAAYDALVATGLTREGIFPRIVIRDDVGLGGAASFAADPAFAGVVALGFVGGQYCSGVLIAPTTVLSARHCAPVPGEFVRFGTNYSSPAFSSNIQAVSFPGGGSAGSPLLDGGDVAIVTLAQAVPATIAAPLPMADATTTLNGVQVATLGYGLRGIGSTGATGFDGIRRGGSNTLDFYGAALGTSAAIVGTANIFSTDFDDPSGTSNTLGWLGSSAAAGALEATTAAGDSGGPLLFDNGGQWTVIGVLSGGTTDNSVYGDISWWTGVAPFRTQIEAAGGVFISVVPEPGALGLMLAGLGLLGLRLGCPAPGNASGRAAG